MKFFAPASPFRLLLKLYVVLGFVLRIVLLFHPITSATFTWKELAKIFGTGVLTDLFVFIVASFFLWWYLLFLSNQKYQKPWGYILFSLLCFLLLYITFGNTILNDYGGSLPEIVITFVAIKTLLFGLFLFFPNYRKKLRLILYSITIFIFVLVLVQNTLSEYFFWNEFGVRYNFIAVDYLVYTNEVIKNIMESYPVIPLFTGVGLITAIITFFMVRKSKGILDPLPSFSEKMQQFGTYLALFVLALFAIPILAKQETSTNIFANELQANGLYRFYLAFQNSELEYPKFYKTIPEKEAFAILQKQIGSDNANATNKKIHPVAPEIKKNVMLITVESLSASYMKTYGYKYPITPFLDSLETKSTVFSNLYAVGNRTIRGLEAVTLCLPPSPGESIVKRKDNKNKFSTGSIFAKKGYAVNFIYGGDAYFDNMEDFFAGNGYRIVDKKTMQPSEINFANVWGVCDEDMAKKSIQVANSEYQKGKLFFNHWMTVSNHRPFTYPEGKVAISPSYKMREGGILYTDYAIKQFFKMAQKQKWYHNTIFVIVADHCASSAGKTELPVDKYKIPALIFEPGQEPTVYTNLMSQIDVMPTLLGKLNFQYESKFYGQNVFDKNYQPRAFIATYQDLGYIKKDVLTILSPKQKVKQYQLIPQKGTAPKDFQLLYEEKPVQNYDNALINETVANYQTAYSLLKNKKLNR